MKNILIRISFLLFMMGCTTLGHTTLLNYDGGHQDALPDLGLSSGDSYTVVVRH